MGLKKHTPFFIFLFQGSYKVEPYGLCFATTPYQRFDTPVIVPPMGTNRKKKVKKMPKKNNEPKDLSMEDEAWNSRVEDVETFLAHAGNQEFLSSTETIEDGVELIRMNIRRGNRNPAKRKTFWKQILDEGREWKREHGANVEMDWPTSQGKPSNLPAHVQQSTSDIYDLTYEAAIDYWNNNQIVQITAIRSGRNKEEGGQPYPDAVEYAKTRAFAMKQRFVKLFNDGRWDGNFSLEEGMTIALPPADENQEEGDEDDSSDA